MELLQTYEVKKDRPPLQILQLLHVLLFLLQFPE